MLKPRTTYLDLIARNRRNSVLLVICMVLLLSLLGLMIGITIFDRPSVGFILAGALSTLGVIMGWMGGDELVLLASSANPLEKRDHPQLYNVVEEMSLAAGVPPPRVYIIEDSAPNAFATGRDPDNATIVVTRGLLDKLDRDELQGVIAHELAHVRNYDIRIMMLVAVLAGAIVILADMYGRTMWYGGGSRRSRDSDSGTGGAIMMVVGLLLALVAPLIARMLQYSVSREREYLADATAVQFTRYPDGLANALEKLLLDDEPLEAANRGTAHMYIINPLDKMPLDSAFSTHPPIDERIKRLRALSAQYSR